MEHNENKDTVLTFDGTINGHEYVDLGLSVKWATCNVGAASPLDHRLVSDTLDKTLPA